MSSPSIVFNQGPDASSLIQHRAFALLTICCLFLLQALIRFQSDLVSDAAWYLYMADGLVHGKHLYIDFIEVNPPLAVWLVVPVAWVGGLTGLGSIPALYGTLLALTAVSVVLVNRYLRLMPHIPAQNRRWFMVLTAGILLFIPAGDFGEREHFMVLLFMPWVFLRLARSQGAKPAWPEAAIIGVMAAVAICFKPQSLMAPVAVELFLFWRRRKWPLLLSVENLAAAACVIAYAGVLLVTEQEFLHVILKLGVKAYVPFYGYPSGVIWFGSLLTVTLIFLAYALRWQDEAPFADITVMASGVALGFLVSYFIQYKGFAYQVIPALTFASVGCAAGVVGSMSAKDSDKLSLFRKGVLVACLTLSIAHVSTHSQHCVCDERITASTLHTYAPHAKSVFIASTRVGSAFPLVVNGNLVWASRLPTSWLTPYVASKWQDGALPDDEIVSQALDWAVTDFATFQPDIVFVDEDDEQSNAKEKAFDYLKFWSRDARFAELWAHYQRRGTVSGFAVYTRS